MNCFAQFRRAACAGAMAMFASVPAMAQSPAASPTPVEIRVDAKAPTRPLAPPSSLLSAYIVEDVSQFFAGYLADTWFGDAVLENSQVRIGIAKPGKEDVPDRVGGNVIDVAHKKYPLDWIASIELSPDLESSGSVVIYDRWDPPGVAGDSTAQVTVHGYVRPEPGAEAVEGSRVDVTTTYSLPLNSNILTLETALTNNTPAPVVLLPGVIAEWGTANAAVEAVGQISFLTEANTEWVGCLADDYSLFLFTPESENIYGYHQRIVSAARIWGAGNFEPGDRERLDKGDPTRDADERPEEPMPPPGFRMPILPRPTTETEFAPPGGMPVSETQAGLYVPQPLAMRTAPREYPGGSTDDDTTGTATQRLTLAPGESVVITRFLAVSDDDFDRATEPMWRMKGRALGAITGIVLEEGTQRPLGGVEIRITGGPGWTGQTRPRFITRGSTAPDGTFAIRVPAGAQYIATPVSNGRRPLGQPQPATVEDGGAPPIVPLVLSRPTMLRVGVSEAETATSVPLPAKVTVIAKSGPSPDWGLHTDVTKGLRNTLYAVRGGIEMPINPGSYRVVVSRGIEYDTAEFDVDVQQGVTVERLVALPKVIATPGEISVDAGVLTDASAVATVTARDRVIMAACEGVEVLVSGDYEQATDFTPHIRALGLESRLKAFRGMRILQVAEGMTADILVYPLNDADARRLLEFRNKHRETFPDIFLADLRKEFPKHIIQVDAPLDPKRGYLRAFPYVPGQFYYEENQMPPPDFDALQIVDGKRTANHIEIWPQYMVLTAARTRDAAGAPALAPVGGSAARLPFDEVGYPRMILGTPNDTLDRFDETSLVNAIRSQRVMVSSGPFLRHRLRDPKTEQYSIAPGSVADYSSTRTLETQMQIEAAPWVGTTIFDQYLNPKIVNRTQLPPSREVKRYPVSEGRDRHQIISPGGDALLSATAIDTRTPLTPVVRPNPSLLGGERYPEAWVSPMYIDGTGDGKVVTPERFN